MEAAWNEAESRTREPDLPRNIVANMLQILAKPREFTHSSIHHPGVQGCWASGVADGALNFGRQREMDGCTAMNIEIHATRAGITNVLQKRAASGIQQSTVNRSTTEWATPKPEKEI
jgi:hypothetical protein